MADEQSIQIMSFNFGARTVAHQSLAQGVNWSFSALNNFVQDYLDPVVQAGRCAQCVDDISKAAHTADELLQNIELKFQQVELARLKLSMSKCTFGKDKVEFLGITINNQGIAPLLEKVERFLTNLKLPIPVKSLQSYTGFVHLFRQYIPKLVKKHIPLYQLIQNNTKSQLTQVHEDAIFNINGNIAKIVKLSLRLPLPNQQLVTM